MVVNCAIGAEGAPVIKLVIDALMSKESSITKIQEIRIRRTSVIVAYHISIEEDDDRSARLKECDVGPGKFITQEALDARIAKYEEQVKKLVLDAQKFVREHRVKLKFDHTWNDDRTISSEKKIVVTVLEGSTDAAMEWLLRR